MAKHNYPTLTEGDKVRVNRDVLLYPLLARFGGRGYGEPYVYVPAGSIGTIGKASFSNTYRVHFEQTAQDGPLLLHISSLEVIPE